MALLRLTQSPHFLPAAFALALNLAPLAFVCVMHVGSEPITAGEPQARPEDERWYVDPTVLMPQAQGNWSCGNPDGCEVELIDF